MSTKADKWAVFAEHLASEIRLDLADGVVPRRCRSFADLYDYIDANIYTIDALAVAGIKWRTDGETLGKIAEGIKVAERIVWGGEA